MSRPYAVTFHSAVLTAPPAATTSQSDDIGGRHSLKCVHPESDHLIIGSRRENMLDRAFDGRHSNGTTWRWRGVGRKAFADRSRALRDAALRHGWDPAILWALDVGHGPGRTDTVLSRVNAPMPIAA